MDKLPPVDWSALPSWLLAVVFLGTGVVVPIVLALIGRRRAHSDPPAPAAPTPIQIESPWFLQNFLDVQRDVREAKAATGEIKAAIAMLSSQVAALTKLMRQRQNRNRKGRGNGN